MDNFPVFKKEHAYDILHMVKDTFQDFDIEDEFDKSSEEFYEDSCVYDLEFGSDYTDDESEMTHLWTPALSNVLNHLLKLNSYQ